MKWLLYGAILLLGLPGRLSYGQGGDYVAAPDLARTLREIDPAARLDWDGEVFRIQAGGQFFSLFLKGRAAQEMIVNGQAKALSEPLVFRDNEFFVPSGAVDIIGQTLEQAKAPQPTPTPDPTTTDPQAPTADVTLAVALPEATPVALAFPTPLPPRATPVPTPLLLRQTPAAGDRSRTADGPRNLAAVAPAPIRSDSLPTLLADRTALRQLPRQGPTRRELQTRARQETLRKILLDADDSALLGTPPPPRGPQTAEATLAVARMVREILQPQGMEVILVRQGNERISAAERVRLVQETEADLYLILSISEAESAEISGVRALFPSHTVDPVLGRTIDRSLDELVAADQVYRPFEERSRAMASAFLQVMRNLGNQATATGGGSAPAPLFVPRRAPMPSVNLVLGYATNPGDSTRLASPEGRRQAADALAETLLQFSNRTRTSPPAQASTMQSVPDSESIASHNVLAGHRP